MWERTDPRFLLIVNNLGLLLFGFWIGSLNRGLVDFFYSFTGCLLAQVLVSYILEGKENWLQKLKKDSWKSAFVSSVSLMILVSLRRPEIYFILGFFSILSKLLFRHQGGHYFNPTNAGIIFAYAFFPEGYLSIYPDKISLHTGALIYCLFWGILANIKAKRILMPCSYLFFMASFAFLLEGVIPMSFFEIIGPEIGLPGLIFLFFMMTDPKTSPEKPSHRFLFVFCLAMLTLFFRYLEIFAAPFLGLFICTLIYGLYLASRMRGERESQNADSLYMT